jgi:hypothetical protein
LEKDAKPGDKGTEIKIGSKRSFKLTIQMPKKDNQDMLVELFTPDNETTIMLLCNVRITHQGRDEYCFAVCAVIVHVVSVYCEDPCPQLIRKLFENFLQILFQKIGESVKGVNSETKKSGN